MDERDVEPLDGMDTGTTLEQETAEAAVFPEQKRPVVTAPEELIAAGLMPQVPYEKTARVPEGWEPLAAHAVATYNRRSQADISDRHLTLLRGRTWAENDDPDRPVIVTHRLALFGVAEGEGREPSRWMVTHQEVGKSISSGSPVEDAELAWSAFGFTAEGITVDGKDGEPRG